MWGSSLSSYEGKVERPRTRAPRVRKLEPNLIPAFNAGVKADCEECGNLDAPLVDTEQPGEDPGNVDPEPHQREHVDHVGRDVVVLGGLPGHGTEADGEHVAADIEEDGAGHDQPSPEM